jgi:16S rRNA processing protein RimM
MVAEKNNPSPRQPLVIDEPLVIVARAVRPRGLKGEIVAEMLTDFPDRFKLISRFFATSPQGETISLGLERFSFYKDRVILKLAGYDTIESASELVGYEFAVPEAERVELADDEFYDWELEGCKVDTISGQLVGAVTGVMRTGGANLLVVERDNPETDEPRTSLIPMVGSIMTRIDKERKLITIDPPEGLLEL